MKPRLVIITEIIAPYRVPVFNSLAAHGEVDLHVLFLAETDPKLRQWTIPKDEIRFSYHVLPSFRLRLGNLNLLVNRGLDRALRQARPDAILCGGYNYPSSWLAAFWARKRNIPFLLWTESNAADHRGRSALVEYLKRKFLGLCRGFVVPGEASKSYLQQLGLPAELIFKAPDAVDNELFTQGARIARTNLASVRKRIDVPERYFLNVGRLIRAKGVLDLLEAYANLDEEIRAAVGLVFVGDGDAKGELIRRASLIRPGNREIFWICSEGAIGGVLCSGRRSRVSHAQRSLGPCGQRSHGLQPPCDSLKRSRLRERPDRRWLERLHCSSQ